ncbi:universal stress protein [Trinickia soli]|uniref:Universal stress protein UspA n=1 Tax=Trinickia soli TaxID=380675 RepID=A0A2N7VEU0_9BURK|nr:universal stress protein [Trinickia soli]KAA0087953.1 universal stress protein [Paraburkholderia sp. T12-10]PMS15660.1 universal stress protein UspA [Trinickia soli]CAB3728153.1 TRAP-T-associated universal stress protein TeaD [Trinickia soli]
MYKRILVPVDGSDGSRRALDEAIELARLSGAQLQAVYVLEHPTRVVDVSAGFAEQMPVRDTSPEIATTVLGEARERLAALAEQGSVRAIDAYGESLATVLARAIDELDADLVVMYSHGRSGIRRLFAGSVAESLLHNTTVPLLLLRNGEQE